jgi:uncharacterized integral membrane protein
MAWEKILDKKLNQTYRGKAEYCDWSFTVNLPDQVGASWTAQQSLNAHIEELQKQGAIILEYRLWEDKSPTWSTDYYVQVVSSASPIAWMVIIIGVLAILALVATYFVIHETGNIVEYVGEKAPFAISATALAILGAVVIAFIVVVRGKKQPTEGGET